MCQRACASLQVAVFWCRMIRLLSQFQGQLSKIVRPLAAFCKCFFESTKATCFNMSSFGSRSQKLEVPEMVVPQNHGLQNKSDNGLISDDLPLQDFRTHPVLIFKEWFGVHHDGWPEMFLAPHEPLVDIWSAKQSWIPHLVNLSGGFKCALFSTCFNHIWDDDPNWLAI